MSLKLLLWTTSVWAMMAFWNTERLVTQVVLIGLLIWGLRILNALVAQGNADRIVRMRELTELKNKTGEVLKQVAASGKSGQSNAFVNQEEAGKRADSIDRQLTEIHSLANGNLEKVQQQLKEANEHIHTLELLLREHTKTASEGTS